MAVQFAVVPPAMISALPAAAHAEHPALDLHPANGNQCRLPYVERGAWGEKWASHGQNCGSLLRHAALPITTNLLELREGKGVANRSYSHYWEGPRNCSGFCRN
jgi:hypothetical protein